jgi:L-alanine-DL-glutamate epimerase-like enolase superfamily enzyme
VSPDDQACGPGAPPDDHPIASGEREFTRFDFQDLLERRALDIAQPDVARAGGMTEIRRIAALTSAHGVRLAPHAWGSGVLFAASMHVAMSAPNCHILEVTQGYMPMMWELFNEPFDIRPGSTVRLRPAGLGCAARDALGVRYVAGPSSSSQARDRESLTAPVVGTRRSPACR